MTFYPREEYTVPHVTPRGVLVWEAMKLIDYFKETRAELKHVAWPTRKQAIMYTIVVIAISLVTAGYLGFFDYVFSKLLQTII